ncbi:MAG: NAD(P)H-dependent glycerol-3-phosphate dehydrogenase, partial [Planctomycetota bacterium]
PPAVVVLSGPRHAPEVARRLPTGVVAAAKDPAFARQVQDWFATGYFRIYTHADVIGVECGGALKQPIAIAAGICDGLWLGDSTKSSLIARGLAEAVRFGVSLGAKRETFSGLSGVGDLITSCMSFHGRNRAVGEAIGRGERLEDVVARMSQVAEGVTTVQSICRLADQKGIEMPICREVHRILFEGKEPKAAVRDLMMRDLKAEFD